ncbi:MAG: MFS transporter [Candidatus Zixiibacteriota bacterium]|nr:MAG: MFS transporter [candidate division Zixibacteria bacterium]
MTISSSKDSMAVATPVHKNGLVEYVHNVRRFSKNARLYLIGSFLLGVNFQVFQLLLNLYLKELGFGEGQIGMVNSSRALGMTMMAIPAALLLSRIRLKPVLLSTVGLFALFSFGLASSRQYLLLAGFALLAGMCFAFYRVAAAPFFMRNSTPAERTHLFSFSFSMMLLAGMLGSIGAGKLVMLLTAATGDVIMGYEYTLYIGIGFGLLALLPFGAIKAAAPSAEERRITFNWQQARSRVGFYVKITLANFLIGVGAGLIIPFLNLYFRDRFHLQPDNISYYYFFVQCAMLIGTLTGPLLTRRFGLVRSIVLTQMLSIPFMLILSYAYFLPLAVVAFVIRGGLMNIGVPLGTNFAMEICEREEQGLVNALLMVSWTGSWMVSAAVGGHLIEQYGYTVTLNVAALLYVLSVIVYFTFFRQVEQRHKTSGQWYVPQVARHA